MSVWSTSEFYNSYFGTPYPLKKLDLLAIPDFAAGAMENCQSLGAALWSDVEGADLCACFSACACCLLTRESDHSANFTRTIVQIACECSGSSVLFVAIRVLSFQGAL